MGIRVLATALEPVLVVETDCFRDERGFFMETYNRQVYAAAGLDLEFVQDNHSQSRAGVVRGLHYQDLTAPMAKLVRCTRGAVLDVAVDLRAGSATLGRWVAVELTEESMRQLLVPVGFAHGFLALSDRAEVQYKCTNFYAPGAEGAVRWDDPDIGIEWPPGPKLVSEKDQQAPTLAEYLAAPAFPADR